MPIRKLCDGNEAAAYGVKLSKPEVMAVYPISPQTPLANRLASWVATGEIKAKYVTVESEHAAMSVLAGASAAGARTFTASSSQGIVFMEELIWQVAGRRLPVVMAIVNRTIAWPSGLRPEHTDALLQRDSGWILIFCENSQEVLDTCIQAYKIAEDERVYLPVAFCYDGYEISHCSIPIEIPDQDDVDDFLPPYEHKYVYLDVDRPLMVREHLSGPGWDCRMETRYQVDEAMKNARKVIKEVGEEYGKRFGRSYGLIEKYKCDNARAVLITMGAITGVAKYVVDKMQEDGKPIGVVKLRVFRPFPVEELREMAKEVEAIGVIDRNISYGSAGGGIGCVEIARALYHMEERPLLAGFYAGLAGREVLPSHIEYAAEKLLKICEKGKVEKEIEWIGLRR